MEDAKQIISTKIESYKNLVIGLKEHNASIEKSEATVKAKAQIIYLDIMLDLSLATSWRLETSSYYQSTIDSFITYLQSLRYTLASYLGTMGTF